MCAVQVKAECYFKPSEWVEEVLSSCPSLSTFVGSGGRGEEKSVIGHVPFYLSRGPSQIVYALKVRKALDVMYEREILPLDDGAELGLDWALGARSSGQHSDAPIAILCHGITGASDEKYIQYFIAHNASVCDSVVMNYRGCGGVPLKTPLVYSACDTRDLRQVIAHVKKLFPHRELICVGFSLGSILLIRYLAEMGTESDFSYGICVSNVWDMEECRKNLSLFRFRHFYNRRIGGNLKAFFMRNKTVFEGTEDKYGIDYSRAKEIVYGEDYDEIILAPMYGFSSRLDYYKQTSSVRWVDHVKIPLLCINAWDDPFAPSWVHPFDKITKKCENVIYVMTDRGGHLGFIQGKWKPLNHSLVDKICGEYIASMTTLKKSSKNSTKTSS
eukprot:TRINITY_DN15585_c0_g1_i1.p1 TRINITY_DN15585_c0_g1~~TRINITY_DN15585_c0_g1_i1.p1  ORF type:complete len:386 (-),score=73.70 TRINITY_DN15585_c0_g1_i1:726-1883(-)